MLRASEHVATPSPSVIFTFGLIVESIKELGGASLILIQHDIQMAFRFLLYKLTQDPYDVATWQLFLLLPQGCLVLPPCGKVIKHKEMRVQFKHFLIGKWENLHIYIFYMGPSFNDKSGLSVSSPTRSFSS